MNHFEARVEGEHVRVCLNGVLINDFTNTDPARALAGYISLQNHGTGDDVSFRHVRLLEPGTSAGPIRGACGTCVDVAGR
ncbi:DUF1080 domain-containing protein [Streptomyces sp. WMMC500]|uniref:family 16 glycoside hydrolase n=1 Tax=Streptomyces sp. WMMC500 TaxID=3015154 RepID=UPI00248BF228|nr:family 16 glycoside hydrolase [Streptomyces sp. WMMC500]WBB61995.1 DUF1080 domain-containing protein [Streptomyces sp. WMMC500]